MPDLLIRDVPEDVIASLDLIANRLGLSRSDYLRRALARIAPRTGVASVRALAQFEATFTDLADEDVMRDAWR